MVLVAAPKWRRLLPTAPRLQPPTAHAAGRRRVGPPRVPPGPRRSWSHLHARRPAGVCFMALFRSAASLSASAAATDDASLEPFCSTCAARPRRGAQRSEAEGPRAPLLARRWQGFVVSAAARGAT
nr:unnamed protein product [Digitaria exilis]